MNLLLKDLINGTLLGDGCVFIDRGVYARYKVTAKDEEFLNWLRNELKRQGMKCYTSMDKRNNTHVLYGNANKIFQEFRENWYTKENGKTVKTVPKDLHLNSSVILYWYLGDGSLIRQKNNRVPRIVLATNCYTKRDVDFLIDKLKGLGLNFYASESVSGFNKGKKCGYVIISYTQDGTPYSFFRLIGLQCPSEIVDCLTGFKGRGSKAHYFRGKWPSEEDWIAILSNVQGIGKTIRTKRKGLGLSTRELAELTGVKARHIRHIEHGDRYPSLSLLRKLLKVLNINAIYLLERLGDLGYGIRQNQTRGEEH